MEKLAGFGSFFIAFETDFVPCDRKYPTVVSQLCIASIQCYLSYVCCFRRIANVSCLDEYFLLFIVILMQHRMSETSLIV